MSGLGRVLYITTALACLLKIPAYGQKYPETAEGPWFRTVDMGHDGKGPITGSFRKIPGTDYYASCFIDDGSSPVAADFRCQQKIYAYRAFGFTEKDFRRADVCNPGDPEGEMVLTGGTYISPSMDEEVKLFRSRYSIEDLRAGVIKELGSGGFYLARLNKEGHMDISYSKDGWKKEELPVNTESTVRITIVPDRIE